MATISITIPNEHLTRVVDAFCGQHGYQALIDNGQGEMVANPESRNAFAKRMVAIHAKNMLRTWEANQAVEAAKLAAIAAAEEVSIT